MAPAISSSSPQVRKEKGRRRPQREHCPSAHLMRGSPCIRTPGESDNFRTGLFGVDSGCHQAGAAGLPAAFSPRHSRRPQSMRICKPRQPRNSPEHRPAATGAAATAVVGVLFCKLDQQCRSARVCVTCAAPRLQRRHRRPSPSLPPQSVRRAASTSPWGSGEARMLAGQGRWRANSPRPFPLPAARPPRPLPH